ncbi:MAG TPA: hypothetical protein VGN23_11985 [Verrucomicrobiae bacterium]|jgi:hypothetical protein
MKKNLQSIISLVLLLGGSIICAFHSGQYSGWLESDNNYKAHIEDLGTNEITDDLAQQHHDYYLTNYVTFKPSGRMYSGSAESGTYIVGGGAVALFGLVGFLDTFRKKKNSS